jgi:hypothetical protein
MEPVTARTLVDKERVHIDGNLYFKLYFFEEDTGEILQVLSPVKTKIKKVLERDGVFNDL